MKRAFTLLELLVASMLLGMLVTVLTVILNQSSVAWRLGEKTISKLNVVREKMAAVRAEDDNAFVRNGRIFLHVSPWDDDGNLRERTFLHDTPEGEAQALSQCASFLANDSVRLSKFRPVGIGSATNSSMKSSMYKIIVKSAGPNRTNENGLGDDIWSFVDGSDK